MALSNTDLVSQKLLDLIFNFPNCILEPEEKESAIVQIENKLQSLSTFQQRIIVLKFKENKSIKEIASTLSYSESFIRNKLNQAIHLLTKAGNYKYRQMLEKI